MKYCVNCSMDLGNVDLIEKDGLLLCPNCEHSMMELSSPKLERLVKDISNAFYNIKEPSVQNNAKALIENAKVIENGERKLRVQYTKKLKQLQELEYELSVIQNIGDKLNYNLKR